MIELAAGNSRVKLLPRLGGAILSWHIGDQPMLRDSMPAVIGANDPLDFASFPLVPFSNRIADGRFIWQGQEQAITPNFAPEPHAIHGIGWTSAWQVMEAGASEAVLEYRHEGNGDWPWPFIAQQHFMLKPDSLEIRMRAQNLADHAVPLAFGLHPYFDAEGAELQFSAGAIWLNDANSLPSESVAIGPDLDFSNAASVEGKSCDNCFAGWDGTARIMWAHRPLVLNIASDADHAVLYIPGAGSFFCFEPVPHANAALNQPGQPMPVVAPNAYFETSTLFEAVPADHTGADA